MKLMIEHAQDVNLIVEEKEGKRNYLIEGIFAQAELPNRNGRNYPGRILAREVHNYQQVIESRMALGELNHPASPSVNPERASHLITSLKMEGTDAMGRAKVLDTPMGRIVKNLLDENVRLGVSTRGLGSVKYKNGINEVQDDFKLVCIDVVSSPSGINCFVNGIMENADWIMDATGSWQMVESIQKEIKSISAKEVEARKGMFFEQFLKSIR